MAVPELRPAASGSGNALGGCALLRELFNDGDYSLASWRCLEDGPGLRSERAHSRPVVAYGFSGSSIVSHGRCRVQIDPALALLFRRGDPYSTTHPWGCECAGCHVGLTEELVEELAGRDAYSCRPLSRAFSLRSGLELQRLVWKLESGAAVEALAVGETLLEIARTIFARISPHPGPGKRPGTTDLHQRIVGRTCALLVERFSERLSICQVSRQVGASAAHLQRIFRRQVGVSIHDYVVRLRVLSALARLLEGDGDLSSIACDVGFSSHSHLSGAFRRILGQPPTVLRASLSKRTGIRALAKRLQRQVEAPLRSTHSRSHERSP